ncbi:MAG TPA: hypothetical protein VG755_33135 [Nannocystaceae bacterium]|nr:hypothetical protein [Nannocystaceae bacterium]
MVDRSFFALALILPACGSDTTASGSSGGSETSAASTSSAATTTSSTTMATSGAPSTGAVDDESSSSAAASESSSSGGDVEPGETLEVRFLGVGGFALRHGEDLVLTAPLYSNPGVLEVQFGSIAPDPARIDAFLDPMFVQDAAAILSGHAHYDHLLDVPYVWSKTDHALVLANADAAKLLEAEGMPADAIVALDDPELAWVDSRNCPDPDPCTGLPAGNEGAWLELPQSHVRVRALCSSHPAQVFGVIHFGEGCVDGEPTEPPPSAGDWKEGQTLAYLIDFLDPRSGAPIFRVYAQDAPTDAPIGHPVPELLDEKRVDLALLNVGSWENVTDHPGAIISAMQPRYVIGGHWEDFFRPQDEPLMEIPFAAPAADFDAAAIAALGDATEPAVIVDGRAQASRYFRVAPGTDFELAAR